MTLRENFGDALRTVRRLRKVPQEALDVASSRTYISSLERGLKSPTLDKIDSLANALNVHPLSLLALTYLKSCTRSERQAILAQVESQLEELSKVEAEARD
ncbi:helix-turn-helix domain-containing protein [Cupriavidus pauculus]|uniref:helix-turn-helix domain-containing protein n=1 Tax=Cupriavidus pauculus TaxID=82633 RepID=UPI001478D09B|nr:helix-turn-helix transcriptional regulator [Cupriavidus pauculus]